MQIAHQFEVGASRDRAYVFLRDVALMAPCLPGCTNLQEAGPDKYTAIMEISVAFLKLKFDVQVELVESEAPSRIKAKITGKPMALAGQLSIQADLTLAELSEKQTTLAYALEISLTGKLGSVGQSAFRAKAEQMGELFARNLKAALEGNGAEVAV